MLCSVNTNYIFFHRSITYISRNSTPIKGHGKHAPALEIFNSNSLCWTLTFALLSFLFKESQANTLLRSLLLTGMVFLNLLSIIGERGMSPYFFQKQTHTDCTFMLVGPTCIARQLFRLSHHDMMAIHASFPLLGRTTLARLARV
jgi:hypothetical protein